MGPNLQHFLNYIYKQCLTNFNIINNDAKHKNYDTTMCQSYSTYFNSIGKKYTPCQGVVWSQYRLSGTFHVPIFFGVVLFAKVCFFLPILMQFWKAVDFTLALLYLNFKLQYLLNSLQLQFQSFLQIPIASSLYYMTVAIRRPEFLGPQIL